MNNQFNLNGGEGPGSHNQPFRSTIAQYFYGITIGRGWPLLSAPAVTYDWKADSEDPFFLPIGAGIARIIRIGGTAGRFLAIV